MAKRWGLAALGGALMASAFPTLNLAGAAWVAPAVILFAAFGLSGRLTFGLGYASGLVVHWISLAWLLQIPFPLGAIAGWLALSAYLALYQGTWVWLCWRVWPVWARSHGVGDSVGANRRDEFLRLSWWQRGYWALFCAASWAGLEIVQAHFLTGFPWNLLGVSQYQVLPVIQIASVGGVYSVSFLVVWLSVALGMTALRLIREPLRRPQWLADSLVPALALAALLLYGVRQLAQPNAEGPRLSIALVQPSIPQTLIWDPSQDQHRFGQLIDLSRQALEQHPDLLVWPEAAFPTLLRYDNETYAAVAELAREFNVWIILGADDAEPRPDTPRPDDYLFFNSAFLVAPDGSLKKVYRKQRLVVFGEYVPLLRWLPFLKYLTPIQGSFTPGEEAIQFRLPSLDAQTSVLICFEDNFPHLVREAVEPETDFLLNLTNNGWFGESAAQWQHAANAAFRAVENRIPLVRCTNNGLTCWIDAQGRWHEVEFESGKNIYQAGVKLAQVPLASQNARTRLTVYQRWGDWFGWSCVGFTLFGAAGSLWLSGAGAARGVRSIPFR